MTAARGRIFFSSLAQGTSKVVVAVLVLLIRAYQFTLSPLLSLFGPVCRFEPSCSRYMIEALRRHGLVVGLRKGIARLLRCHPFHPGGYDPP